MGASWGDPEPAGARLERRTLLRGSQRLRFSQATAPGRSLADGLGAPMCSREPVRPRVPVQSTSVAHHPQDLSQSQSFILAVAVITITSRSCHN